MKKLLSIFLVIATIMCLCINSYAFGPDPVIEPGYESAIGWNGGIIAAKITSGTEVSDILYDSYSGTVKIPVFYVDANSPVRVYRDTQGIAVTVYKATIDDVSVTSIDYQSSKYIEAESTSDMLEWSTAENGTYLLGFESFGSPFAHAVVVVGNGVSKSTGFSDVPSTSWCADSVNWAVSKGITTGTSATTFSPDDTCTQEQIITFLYRANESPNIVKEAGYTDVAKDAWYYAAVNWGADNGLRTGSVFGVGTPCSRSDVVYYLWTLAGKPTVDTTNKFSDVATDAEYAQAVAWAVNKGITAGTSDTTFSPDNTCTRAQIVTFLFRNYK